MLTVRKYGKIFINKFTFYEYFCILIYKYQYFKIIILYIL